MLKSLAIAFLVLLSTSAGAIEPPSSTVVRTTFLARDFGPMLALYQDILGYEVVYRDTYQGETFRDLFNIDDAATVDFAILFSVTDDLDGVFAKVKAADASVVTIVAPPFATSGGREMVIADANGVRIYVFESD